MLSVTSHFLDETVVLLANNVKDLVAVGKVQTLYEAATGVQTSEFCKLRITAIINARLITTELGSNQTFGMGQDIFWPRKLIGRPIQIVRASEPAVPQDQTSSTQPKISTDEALEQQDHVFNYGFNLYKWVCSSCSLMTLNMKETERE